ncbi:MAG: uroporphyrinogen decarboxylase family protein [Spirochaetales bacterium]|nr:uroporphyrinogen decarboxylase family protein [Spirochaetales bacterium]
MNSKERLLAALHREKPDRLPATIHQWQGYHLDTYMGGISDLEAFEEVGLDAQIQYFADMGQFWLVDADFTKINTPQWRDEPEIINDDPDDRRTRHVITTPEKVLTYETAGNSKTTWITKYLIEEDEDIELIRKYMPVPPLDPKPIEDLYDDIGDRGILRGFVWGDQAGCWQHAACLIDISELIFAAIDKPDWVHRLLNILLEKKLRFIEGMKGVKFDLIETGGGSASTTLISPAFHEEFCMPYARKMHDALHDLGFLTTYHTCGGNYGIEDLIVANHTDASETLAPISVGGNQEPWDFAEKIDGRIAMIGGIDQFNTLEASDEHIREMVRKLFTTVGENGGYICSASDHFFDTPVDKLKTFAAAARECEY